MKAKRPFLGIAVGVAFGLLFDGILLINSSGWLISFVFPVVLPPLLGLIIGLIVGWKAAVPIAPWYVIVLVAVLSWPTALWCPIIVQEWRFRRFAETLPVYRASDRWIREISVIGYDDPPKVSVDFRTEHASLSAMLTFYRDHLVQEGWTEVETQQTYRIDTWYEFQKGPYVIYLIGFHIREEQECVRLTRYYNTPFYRR